MTLIEIKNRIEAVVPNSTAYVLDPMNDGQHLQAIVVSSTFEGMPSFKQQQMVMGGIKEIFNVVHALGLKTMTPQLWEKDKSKYGF